MLLPSNPTFQGIELIDRSQKVFELEVFFSKNVFFSEFFLRCPARQGASLLKMERARAWARARCPRLKCSDCVNKANHKNVS